MLFRSMLSACLLLVSGFSSAQELIEPMPNPTVIDASFNETLLHNLMEAGKPTLIVTYDFVESDENDAIGKSTRYMDRIDRAYGSISGPKSFKLVGLCESVFSDVGAAVNYAKRWKNASIAFDNWRKLISASTNKTSIRLYFTDGDKNLVYVHESSSLDPDQVMRIMNQIASKEISTKNTFYDESWLPCPAGNARYYRKVTYNDNFRGKYQVQAFYKSGKLQMSGYADKMVPLQLNEYCRFYYENGQIQKEYEVVKGKIWSPVIFYHPNGKKAMEGEYVAGDRRGLFTFYYDNGVKQKLAKYVLNSPDSVWTGWFRDGSLRFRAKVVGNWVLLDENTVYKHENGTVAYAYSSDKSYRKIITYFDEKGAKISEYKWPDKNKNDFIEVYQYAPDGKLMIKNTLQEMYQIGTHVIGRYETWHENGQKRSDLTVSYKRMTGVATAWHDNGKLAERVDYDAQKSEYFDPSGNPIARPVNLKVPPLGSVFNERFDLEALNYIGNRILRDAEKL